MAAVLLVSKPIAPPWHDSSKNLVRDLASHMQRHVPHVLSQPGVSLAMPRAQVEGVYPVRASGFAPALADNARVLSRLLVGDRVDVWHFFFAPNPRTSDVARLASLVRAPRTVQTVCSAPREDVDVKRVLFAERVVVLSRHTERRFRDAGIAAERLRLIRPSIAALEPLSRSARQRVREQLGWPLDAPIVVYAGDLEFGRGAELAIAAHAALPRELGAWLVMACRAKTARARAREAELKQQVQREGLATSVRWLGETSRIHDVLAAADLVTLPTDTLYAKMDLPLVLVEAMALERAVLVGEGTPAMELVEGDAAHSTPTEPDAVAAATRRLLESVELRAALGQRARAAAVTRYAAARMATEYEALYDELCTGTA
jgi:glycosyltransferase involved in cell wall biosynthesis